MEADLKTNARRSVEETEMERNGLELNSLVPMKIKHFFLSFD
jgi:hypothetical protein